MSYTHSPNTLYLGTSHTTSIHFVEDIPNPPLQLQLSFLFPSRGAPSVPLLINSSQSLFCTVQKPVPLGRSGPLPALRKLFGTWLSEGILL